MWMDGDSSVMGNSWLLIISWSVLVTLWVSVCLMTVCTHITYTCTHKHQICHFILLWLLKRVSNYEDQVRGGGRAADWAEFGTSLAERRRNGDREMNRQRRGCSGVMWMERRKNQGMRGMGGHTGVPRFMALTSASFPTHCSQTVCHGPPYPHTLLLLSPSPPLVSCERGKESVGGDMGLNSSLFLDAVLCQGRWDKFKDDGEVNVVGRMKELL